MFDYVESRPFALAPDDLGAAAAPVLQAMTGASPVALSTGRLGAIGAPLDWSVTPSIFVRVGAPSQHGTMVEITVTPKVHVLAWALFAASFFVFFPAALGLLLFARERFRSKAKLLASSIFASLGTTSGLVAAGYAAVPPT